MNKTRLPLVLLLCLTLLCGCSQDRSGAFEKALDLFADGNYADAAQAFSRLGDYATAPTYAAYSQGLVLYEQGQFAAAAPYFEQTRDFMYGEQRYRFCSAHALLEAGQYAQAADAFALLPDFEAAPLWKQFCTARAAEESKDYETALYAYEAAGTLEDAEERLYNLRGQIYNHAIALRGAGDYGSAMILFNYLGDYLSSAAQAVECKEFYLDQQYQQADELYAAGDKQAAYQLFTSLTGYRDAAARADAIALELGIEDVDTASQYF